MAYNTPGVYVEEVSKFPPSVAQVETAIPAFIGYTEFAKDVNGVNINVDSTTGGLPYVARIRSFAEYKERFGGPAEVYSTDAAAPSIVYTTAGGLVITPVATNLSFKLYYALQVYFANGGGPCYICAVDKYGAGKFNDASLLLNGLNAIGKEDEPTILVFPDAQSFADSEKSAFYGLFQQAMAQCANLGDRIAMVDVLSESGKDDFATKAADFREGVGNNHLKYAAAYYPYFKSILTFEFNESDVQVSVNGDVKTLKLELPIADETLSVFHANNDVYHLVKKELSKRFVVLAPSSAMAGAWAMVDGTRGVWKAPANVSLNFVKELMVDIDDEDQKDMNVTSSGKSVNAIRKFTGKGVMVWGARTLDGNDNEWRYIPVRRFFNMVEESVKKASMQFVFEPNDANTWVKVRAMIENFLLLQWRAGALAGAKPEDAFYVSVGLGQTMTADDILNGRMIVEIGMAAVRPAEFIILQFSHKMQES